MRKKRILKTPAPHSSFLPKLNFTPDFLYLLPLSSTGGWGMGVVVSSSHIISATPSSSGVGFLTLCPCCSVGSLPRETVLHELLQHQSFPCNTVLHKLPQHGSLPWGAVLQEQAAPVWVPDRVTSPASKPAPAWAPLSMHPQVLAGAFSCPGFPQEHSLLWVHPAALAWGPPWAAGGQPASPWSSSRAAGECLLQHLEHLLPLLLHKPWGLQLFLSHILTHLSCLLLCTFFPLLKYVVPEVLPPLLKDLAVASGWIHLGDGWHWL